MRTLLLFLIASAGFVGSVAWADADSAASVDLSGLVCDMLEWK